MRKVLVEGTEGVVRNPNLTSAKSPTRRTFATNPLKPAWEEVAMFCRSVSRKMPLVEGPPCRELSPSN